MKERKLPDELQHLRNIIDGVKDNPHESLLRSIVRCAADEAPVADLVRIAETILQCGIDVENANASRLN